MKINVILACHNRKELTLRAIGSAKRAAQRSGLAIQFTVVDDGSTDGTSDAISALHPDARIIKGDGTLFWARSMAIAEASVFENEKHESESFIMWLNDDVSLDEDAFSRLSQLLGRYEGTIVVGATRDPETGQTTYSGWRKHPLHPLKFSLINPETDPVPVDTFNGNLVVVPLLTAKRMGGIDGGFAHSLADIDYGLRAGRTGVGVLLAPGTFGACSRHLAREETILQEWRKFTAVKGGGHLRSLVRILRRTNPVKWPMFLASTYLLWWMRATLRGSRSMIASAVRVLK